MQAKSLPPLPGQSRPVSRRRLTIAAGLQALSKAGKISAASGGSEAEDMNLTRHASALAAVARSRSSLQLFRPGLLSEGWACSCFLHRDLKVNAAPH